MKILLIGGTGTISTAVSTVLLKKGCELFHLNRGNRNILQEKVTLLKADIYDEKKTASLIKDLHFDVVVDFIAFTLEHVQRDYRLFKGKTNQYVFISSASVYKKPVDSYIITEETPLRNPYWEYAENKIACEAYLMQQYRKEGFPVTIVRPSHTYSERSVPVGLHGEKGNWQIVKRMIEGKPVIIHGDGTSLWTMTDSRDFAEGFSGLLGNRKAIGEAFHITSDEVLTWNQIYQYIAQALGVQARFVHIASDLLVKTCYYDIKGSLIGDKSNSVVFDNTKLKTLVPDFAPSISFEAGVKNAVDYMLSHKETQIPDEVFDSWCNAVIKEYESSIHAIKNKTI